jgi:polyisoprenoid-binding protein YceI
MFRRIILSSVLVAIPLAACNNDPAKDKPKAEVAAATQAAPAAAPAGAVTYAFSNSNSKLGFVGAKVTGSHDGGFNTFTGTVTVPEGAVEKGQVTVEADPKSIFTDTEKLTGHLKSADFFDVEKYPKVRFQSTAVRPKPGPNGATHEITGNMDLHGVTKAITFPAQIQVEPNSVKVKSEFAINRKDFGINYAGKADDLIRDDVVIKLDINANRTGT